MQAHRLKNPKKVIIGHLNKNFLWNKFTAPKTDTGLISETEIDQSFPNQEFKTNC